MNIYCQDGFATVAEFLTVQLKKKEKIAEVAD